MTSQKKISRQNSRSLQSASLRSGLHTPDCGPCVPPGANLCFFLSSEWVWGILSDFSMHRLTARLLLVLLLTGVFTPVALAITAPAPHACCIRKPMLSSHDAEFQAPPDCCNHDCCRPLNVSQWADVQPGNAACSSLPTTRLQSHTPHAEVLSFIDHAPSVRGPPQFSIA